MSDKDIQRLIDLAKVQLEQSFTQEEAHDLLVAAGIMKEDGTTPTPLVELAQAD